MRSWSIPLTVLLIGLVGYPAFQPPMPTHGQSVAAPVKDPTPKPVITSAEIKFTNPYVGEIGDDIEIVATTECTRLKWEAVPNKEGRVIKGLPSRLVPDPKCVIVRSLKPGEFRIRVYGSLSDGTLSDPTYVVIKITDPDAPTPGPTPVPPGPTPPNPPTPPLPPAPIPADGFRVLMVYESSELGKMPSEQEVVLTSQTIRQYLNSRCPSGPDGKTKEWRIYDKDTDASGESKVWQDALKRSHPTLPWIVISDGKNGFEGPLPKDVNATLDLLKKFGGN